MTTPTPDLIGKRLAAKVFDQRSRKGAGRPDRNVEVHLSEADLAAICAGAARLGADVSLKPHNDAILQVVSTFTGGPDAFRNGLTEAEYAALRDLNVVRIDSGDDREPTAPAAPASASKPATLRDVKVAGDLREQACALFEEACTRLDRSGAVKAAALLRGIIAGMTDGDEVFPGGDLDFLAHRGYTIGTDASENGRGF